jgi:hypothetical protein
MAPIDALLVVLLVLMVIGMIFNIILLFRRITIDLGPIQQVLQSVEKS